MSEYNTEFKDLKVGEYFEPESFNYTVLKTQPHNTNHSNIRGIRMDDLSFKYFSDNHKVKRVRYTAPSLTFKDLSPGDKFYVLGDDNLREAELIKIAKNANLDDEGYAFNLKDNKVWGIHPEDFVYLA